MQTPSNAGFNVIDGLVSKCHDCPLNDNFHLPVPGVGVPNPDIFFLGEAPGEVEAHPSHHPGRKFGVPLVGPAGSQLQNLLKEMGFDSYSFFVTNTVKHRPPNNRPPTGEEKTACLGFLKMQLAMAQPTTVVALGKHAWDTMYTLAHKPIPEKQSLQGKHFSFKYEACAKPIMVFNVYHPSYALLRNLAKKPDLVRDLTLVLHWLQTGRHNGTS